MVKFLQLTQGQIATIDDEDYDLVSSLKWFAVKDNSIKSRDVYYVVSKSKGDSRPIDTRRNIRLHRFILNPPCGMVVDHIDGNPLNNQKSNLRIVSVRENSQNRHNKTTRNYIGTIFLKSGHGWAYKIYFKGRLIRGSTYKTEKEAYDQYQAWSNAIETAKNIPCIRGCCCD